jgi:adenylate cyclase class IV
MIRNAYNPFAGFATPTYVLKADATGLSEAACAAALGAGATSAAESGTVDIYLLPPHAAAATCATWLRMRNRDGRYLLVFEEFVTDGPYIISPNVRFEVNVRILGGLMALGYTVGAILKRSSVVLSDEQGLVTVKLDTVEGFATPFVQVQGRLRAAVEEVARRLGLEDEACIPASYIQQVQRSRAASAAAAAGVPQQPAGAASAAHAPRTSAADALSLFGVQSFGGGGGEGGGGGVGGAFGGGGDALFDGGYDSSYDAAPPPAEASASAFASGHASAPQLFAPATPAGTPAPHAGAGRGGGGGAMAALSSRMDALHDSVTHLQHYAAAASAAAASNDWSNAGAAAAYYNGVPSPASSPPGGGGALAREVASLGAGQRALAARVDSLRSALLQPAAPQQQAQQAHSGGGQAAPWERLALAAALGALLGAAALRLTSSA